MLPHDLLDSLSVEERRERWRSVLDAPHEREATHVGEADGVVVAFSAVGPAGEEAATGELYALYADPEHWGTGAGRALIATARAALRELGFTEAVLWVLDGNDRAIRFYEADSWRADGGRRPFEPGGPGALVVRYRTTLE